MGNIYFFCGLCEFSAYSAVISLKRTAIAFIDRYSRYPCLYVRSCLTAYKKGQGHRGYLAPAVRDGIALKNKMQYVWHYLKVRSEKIAYTFCPSYPCAFF